MFAALICIGTLIIRIPTVTGGFVNMGDAVILFGAYLLGPLYGAAAAGIGSALADIFSGYVSFALGTFFIKALVAVISVIIFKALKGRKWACIPAGIAAELFMCAGYTFYEAIFLGIGKGAFSGLPANLAQGLFGVVVSCLLVGIFGKNKQFANLLETKKGNDK